MAPAPAYNPRATGLRDYLRPQSYPRRLYQPEVEAISDEEVTRRRDSVGPYSLRKSRRYPIRTRRDLADEKLWSNSKRNRSPSPDTPYKRRQGEQSAEALQMMKNSGEDSEETDSIPELSTPEPVRMTGDSPKSPSPTKAGENLDKLRNERKSLTERIQQLDQDNKELDKLLDEVEKRGDTVDRYLESLPQDEQTKKLAAEREKIKLWLADVNKAKEEGAPIPEKPEGDLVYQSQEDAAGKQVEGERPPGPGLDTNRVLDQSEQDRPAPLHEPEQGPRGPSPPATAALPQEERPPIPIEARVIILNQQPPSPPALRREADEADLEDRDEGDSDCQIVESPPEAAEPYRVKSPKMAPKGLWSLKKSKETSITLQLIPNKGGEGSLPRNEPPHTMSLFCNEKPLAKDV